MNNKFYSISVTILALALLLASNFDRARSGIQSAAAAGGVGYITVPAAAFTPMDDTYSYYQSGSQLYVTTPTLGGWFFAPVYLPHGATLTKLTYYWYDDYVGYDSNCQLMATDTTDGSINNISTMIATQGSGGYDSSVVTSFPFPTVDNSRYLYYMECLLFREYTDPYPLIKLYGIRIEYTYPVYLPLTTK